MKFKIAREKLLKPLQQVAGVVEKRQTMPVLANALFMLDGNQLTITGSDLEVELVAKVELDEAFEAGEITIPAKKLLDICKALPDGCNITFTQEDQKVSVTSGRSRFSLATLPANEFPNIEDSEGQVEFSIFQDYLKQLIDKTGFAMAQQDVRFYLNGMLLELSKNRLRTVSTDGHRLAMATGEVELNIDDVKQFIVPRKGILEITRLFNEEDMPAHVVLSENHIRIDTPELKFTSKLIDGKFPDYQRVLPKLGDKVVLGDKDEMKRAFTRVSILSNEKYRGVRVTIESDNLCAKAHNPEQEEAEENIPVTYEGSLLEVGFNVSYLIDVLNAIRGDTVRLAMADTNSSALISDANDDSALYVVMPMRM